MSASRKPRPGQHPAGLGLDAVAAQRLEPVLRLAVRLERTVVAVGVRVAAVGAGGRDVLGQAQQLLLEVGHVRGAAQHLLDDRAVDLLGQLLGQVADAGAPDRCAPRPSRAAGPRR